VIVVADAGPILHLHWIGSLSWGLPATKIHVVEQVWLEIVVPPKRGTGSTSGLIIRQ